LGVENADDLPAALSDPAMSVLQTLAVDGIAGGLTYAKDAGYSGNGQMVAVAALGYDEFTKPIDSAVLVWDVSVPGRPILRLQPTVAFGVSLSPDGGLLYIGTTEPALRVIDVRTGQQVNAIPLTGAMALQPRPSDIDTRETMWDAL
jgi:hypothetical protein